jgi:hypothetical protein
MAQKHCSGLLKALLKTDQEIYGTESAQRASKTPCAGRQKFKCNICTRPEFSTFTPTLKEQKTSGMV